MPTAILTTKLFIPPPRPNAVLRTGLIARLNAGLHHKLTLISAPAGFGKTSLVSAWIAGCGRPAAWLSLDAADNDPTRFLAYLVAALETIAPTLGADIVALLESPQPASIDGLLPLLLNQIAMMVQPAILVLDDYHMLEARPIDQALTFLVEHLPPQLHLVIATREDPALPLARLRARGQITELRAGDLRFSPTEAAGFLNEVMGLDLSAADIATLEDRTEGWIAGLQLAALSIQGRRDVSEFLRDFAGDHRYILDYLVDEVLQRQPEELRSFLLQTAILDRLHGPLCAAVTGQPGSSARLEALHRGNFFLVPLDDTRQWYRYHHLFAEVLRAQLQVELPDLIATLHQRASLWYEQHGAVDEAIRHALAAGDFARAADLVEVATPDMRRTRQEAMLLGWLKAIPDAIIANRPVLSVHYAGALLSAGEFADVEARLRDAERWLEMPASASEQPERMTAGFVVRNEAEFRQLPGLIAVYRAAHALALGDLPQTMAFAQRAIEYLDEDNHVMRGAAHAILGLAYWTNGELVAAYRLYADGMAQLQQGGFISDAIGGATTLADIRIVQGSLRKALQIYERGLQLALDHGMPLVRGTADMYVGMSEILREQNELPAAMQHLLRSREQGEHTGFPQHPYRWRVALARIREAQGDPAGALELLGEAERHYVSDFSPNLRPIAARKARLWIAQGRLDQALEWAREQGLPTNGPISFLREYEQITLVRIFLARARHARIAGDLHEAGRLLERLLHAAEAGERTGSIIEILVLQALAHQLHGTMPAALTALQRALTLAEPEGYVRLFVAEGPPMVLLLREAAAHRIAPEYTDRLLAASGMAQQHADAPLFPTAPARQPLIEPLSQRELDVLRLLNTELSGPEIARELVIGLSTVRTYTKSIYSKLNVSNRRAAVKRATELGLIYSEVQQY
ncbi:MAG TPA: LuxR C-terminal-related transcriptional regulator [Roseiflexaceae bacterium]|nr:LuxR C-terminal-related transcriptional regulator [Roseiflexaceae bacterium]